VVIQPPGETRDADTMTEAYDHEGVMIASGPFDGFASPESIGEVSRWLEREGRGRPAVTYRLRDWLLSRQRYWGAPIPIVHCPEHGEVPVPDDQLPVRLPDDADFTPGGESPLARHPTWKHTTCPRCGRDAVRDTDTMDTFVDSSWYFFRYCSPHEQDGPFDPAVVARWMPVDQYIGGVEHAILHLMYFRFFTKVLRDIGLVTFSEPTKRMINQGQVIFGGASMSKSKGNIVEPMPLVERWGADTMRLSILFAGPFEADKDWQLIAPDPNRRPAMNAWLGRVFGAVSSAAEQDPVREDPEELRRLTHRTIEAVTEDLERLRFNIAISKLQVLTHAIRTAVDAGEGGRDAATALVLMLAPLAPFAAEELWREVLGNRESVHTASWPAFDEELARQERVTLVVQVDGKVRDRIEVPSDASEERCRELALASQNAVRAIGDREVRAVVVRPPRLVNLVTA
jgi:leucyl-tRNA synthetase